MYLHLARALQIQRQSVLLGSAVSARLKMPLFGSTPAVQHLPTTVLAGLWAP